ncbi:MAG: DUF4846 domain-containing protein [Flavobacteriales bacterium]
MKNIFILSSIVLLFTCASQPETREATFSSCDGTIAIEGKNIQERFILPEGFERTKGDSFALFLRSFPLKENGEKVYLYDGREKGNQGVAAAVLDIDVGKKDLQQCADAVMRLRAEYLYQRQLYDKIHFNFTNGFNAEYSKWRQGYRIKVKGNSTSWYKAGEADNSVTSFKKYLEMVFSYAGTLSLSKELKPVALSDIRPGDVFIYGGSPGHAVIVMDVAQNKEGQKIFIIAQSYMPAQSIHVLVNNNDSSLSPWYNLNASDKLYSPEWTFEKSDLKRF